MAFLPAKDTYYRIYFKHSGKCVTVRDASPHMGAGVVQRPADSAGAGQLFTIRHLREDHFAITAKHSTHNLDVARASHEDGAQVIQWERSDGEWNEHFRFVRAGDGLYKIQACHSNKFVVPRDNSAADDVDLVQSGKADGDFAKFRFVPDGTAYDSITGRDFVGSSTELIRTAVIGIVGLVPEVGSGLKFMLGILWPAENTGMLVWDQMKRFVTELMREVIAEERVIDLNKRLVGLRNTLDTYESTSFGVQQKGHFFSNLLTALGQAEPYFFDPRNPEKTLPYFVALGTLYLATLREQYVSYDKIYGQADPDRAKHLKTLQDKITQYSDAARTIRDRGLKWRLDKVVVDYNKTTAFGIGGPVITHRWSAVDHYDGWGVEWQYNSFNHGDTNAEALARGAADNRRRHVQGTWAADLEGFLGPAYLWRYLDPTKTDKPKRLPVDITTGPWGGALEKEFADDPRDKPITAIVVYAGARVDGVEIFYGGVSGGLHGARGGRSHRLDLSPGERIVGVRVRAGGAVDSLLFETSQGRWVGGGGNTGNYVVGDPPDDANASLHRIYGRQGTAHLASIGFTWRYYRDE